jgi:hypothetical protein
MLKREDIAPGEKLVWRPSGLPVEVIKTGEISAYVKAPRGGEFNVLYRHLEKP